MKQKELYKRAVYCRLSLDDGSEGDSSSIHTQKSIAKNIVNYSKQASQFFVNKSSSGVVLRQGVIKIAGAPGGIFNIDGLIRSFWYI